MILSPHAMVRRGMYDAILHQPRHGKGNPMEKIDMTPTWSAMLPLLLEIYENSNVKGRHSAVSELKRMAALADAYVNLKKGE